MTSEDNPNQLNIMIIGQTGAGKSTVTRNLVKNVHGRTLPTSVKIGQQSKGTVEIETFTVGNFCYIDSPGFELKDSPKSTIIKDYIDKACGNNDGNKRLHVVLFCISQDSDRYQSCEKLLTNYIIEKGVRVIILITKAYFMEDKRLREAVLLETGFPENSVIQLLAEDKEVPFVTQNSERIKNGVSATEETTVMKTVLISSYNFDLLIDTMMGLIPESAQNALVAAKNVDLNAKKVMAHVVVAVFSAATATFCLSPIPFTDAAVIVPSQIAMIIAITSIFGLTIRENQVATMLSCILTTSVGSIAGPAIESQLLKFFPGVGWIAGGIISASVATPMVVAFGEAYINVLADIYESSNGEIPSIETIKQNLGHVLKKRRDICRK